MNMLDFAAISKRRIRVLRMNSSLPYFGDTRVLVVGDVMLDSYWHGETERVPAALRGRHQSFTEADIGALRDCGYEGYFGRVEDGVRGYLDALRSRRP